MSTRGTVALTIGGDSFGTTDDVIEPQGQSGGPEIRAFLGYGAAAPFYLNLGNLAQQRRFVMTRTHDTNTDAWAWYESALADWAGVADVVIEHTDFAGTTTSFTIAAAKVDLTVDPPIGVTTLTHITITGGASTSST